MGRFDTLMYDNRNWKGSVALVASMLIGLSVAFKGFDELPDLQADHRAATVALYKAKRVFDRQVIATPAYTVDRDSRIASNVSGVRAWIVIPAEFTITIPIVSRARTQTATA